MNFRKAAGWAILLGLLAVVLFGIAQTVGWHRFATVGGAIVGFYTALLAAIWLLNP